jgi:transposase
MGYVRKTSRQELSPETRACIWERYECGHSVIAISKHFKVPRSTCSSLINRLKLQTTLNFHSKARSGVLKKTTKQHKRALVRYAIANPRCSIRLLGTPSKLGNKLGKNTVRAILKAHGKAKRVPRKKPWLHPENVKRRLSWTRVEKKRKVCWSDEATFYVGENNNVFYITCGVREEFKLKNLRPTFKSGRTAVSVWIYYCGDEMGPLVIIPKGGTMTAKRYLKTLKKYFIPFYCRIRAKHRP